MSIISYMISLRIQSERIIVGNTVSASEWRTKIEVPSTDDPSIFLNLRYKISSFGKAAFAIQFLNVEETNGFANSCNCAEDGPNAGKGPSQFAGPFLRRQMLL